MRYLVLTLSLLAFAAGAALADDIVTMPTANQLKKGETDIAVYYLNLNLGAGAPRHVWYQTLYMGVTDRFELDVHRADVDRDKKSVIFVGSYKVVAETTDKPDVVVGIRNLFGTATTNHPLFKDKSKDQSYFVSAAKTFFLKPDREPGPPLVRAHLSLGTKDWTLLGEKRHEGVFGGLQFLFHPMVGAVVQHDGQDLITGLTLMPRNSGLTLKGGTYGDHSWYGVAYRKTF